MTRSSLGLLCSAALLALPLAAGCSDSGGGSTDDDVGDTAGTDDDTTGTDDEVGTDDTTSDTTTDGTTESTDDSSADTDMDGVPDASDNCPDDANPNQLDFDGNGAGNVCDVMTFTAVSGNLDTTVTADAGFAGSCELPVTLVANGGEVRVRMDDNAQLVAIDLTQMSIDDVPEQVCELLVTAYVELTDVSMSNVGDEFPVSFPHSQAEHDAGTASGMTNVPHGVLTSAQIWAKTDPDEMAEPSDLDLDTTLPFATVDITDAGAGATITWANDMFPLATTMFQITDPIMIDVTVTFTGLNGTLTLAP